MKRALVVGGGGLKGAYDAGVVATLCRELGPRYFDSVYASSVGVFASTFFLSGQADTIEHTWRNHVDSRKLVNILNPYRGRKIMDLEYLTDLFSSDTSRLDVHNVFSSGRPLTYTLTEYDTGRPSFHTPTEQNIFLLMRASCALPFVHGPVIVAGTAYVDGALALHLPVARALQDGYEEIIAVNNVPVGYTPSRRSGLVNLITSPLLPPQLVRLMQDRDIQKLAWDQSVTARKNVTAIRPQRELPLRSIFDTNKVRLEATFDIGIRDAHEFLKTYSAKR